MLTLAAKVSIPERVLCRPLGDEAVLLDLEGGIYYGLDEVGLRIWSLIQDHGDVESVYQTILQEYEVSSDRLRRDLLEFVDLLASKRLLEIHEE